MAVTKKQIEKALCDKSFTLHYQPKVSFLTGQISGAEALIRWEYSENRFISPDEFIPVAEEAGLVTEITAQILPFAIKAIEDLKNNGFDGSIAVNTSPLDFNSNQILLLIQACLDNKQIAPNDIQIELTETASLENNEEIIARLHEVANMGLCLIMDDFGTGYSSIDLLSRLPFSALKIDQGVVRRMAKSTKNLSIVNMVINMARTLRMHVVAEGIENHNTYRFLAYAGCQEAQGYWISKPLCFSDFQIFIQRKQLWPSSHLGMIYHSYMSNVYFRKSVMDALLYTMCGVKEEMASVTRPDIQFEAEKTRMGQWYFGVGQELSNRAHFKAIEKPHREMHKIGGQLFMNRPDDTENMILAFNHAFEEINKNLHLLEAELIAEEPCRKWLAPEEVA